MACCDPNGLNQVFAGPVVQRELQAFRRKGLNKRQRKIVELLLALMALDMSLPEVCSRRWGDVNLKDRIIVGYRGRYLKYGVDVVTALDALLALRPKQHGGQWMLGWQADTARSWLKWVQVNGQS